MKKVHNLIFLAEDSRKHRISCEPVDSLETITVVPSYALRGPIFATAQLLRMMIFNTNPNPPVRDMKPQRRGRNMIIKFSLELNCEPMSANLPGTGATESTRGDILVYNKKKIFVALIKARENGHTFDTLRRAI